MFYKQGIAHRRNEEMKLLGIYDANLGVLLNSEIKIS